MSNIRIDQLAGEMVKAMQEYVDDVTESVDAKVIETAEQVRDEVERLAQGRQTKHKGKYAKGFKVTNADKNGKTRRIIWNKKFYRLVHLLEFGHALRNGGRSRAFPHVKPAYEKYGAKLPEHIKRIIKNGGGK